ncbi:hypothetical protein CCHR01_19848 [Colletotrichum chrysophilum]|uniref:Uncharacterized protein n=1 Tax=Colletotrichum chrysophilum TaxID=1836956 RepID=A0AAD8ZXV6_9PEZI|nr:hypothetical protein CCHR01_19848 [Colletotrichum chrysophilum]
MSGKEQRAFIKFFLNFLALHYKGDVQTQVYHTIGHLDRFERVANTAAIDHEAFFQAGLDLLGSVAKKPF